MQYRSNSIITNALELLHSCTKPSIYLGCVNNIIPENDLALQGSRPWEAWHWLRFPAHFVLGTRSGEDYLTETDISSNWQHFRHWLYRKLALCLFLVRPWTATKILTKWKLNADIPFHIFGEIQMTRIDLMSEISDHAGTLRWRHNGHDFVSNHQPHHCLFKRLFGADQRKHQSSASLAFVREIHRDRWIPRTKGQ